MDCNARAVERLPSSIRVYVIIVLLAYAVNGVVCLPEVRGQGSDVLVPHSRQDVCRLADTW